MNTLFGRLASTWNPWEMLEDINKLAGQFDHSAFIGPHVDVYGDDDRIQVDATLPGFDAESFDIQIEDRELTLSATRPQLELDEGQRWVHRERGYGDFSRSIDLPYAIAADGVKARYADGVLSITLERAPESKARSINVDLD